MQQYFSIIRPDKIDWLIFVTVWTLGGYFIMSSYVENFRLQTGIVAYAIIILVSTPLIMINVFFLIPSFFKLKRIILYFLLFVALIALAFPIETSLREWLVPELCGYCDRWTAYIISNGQQITIFSSFFLAKQYLQFKTRAEQIEKEKVKAELNFLKAQINPHFYFNTLNNLYGLALLKSDDAPQAILKLSEIMEYVIYDAQGERVPLEKEIDYLRNYIELERLRLEPTAVVDIEVTGKTGDQLIAPLILLPLIENAFKHGTTDAENVNIQIRLEANEQQLELMVINTFESNDKAAGLGIDNLTKRLDLIYPGQYELLLKKEGGLHKAYLRIDAK
ncbi:MAG: sensor histidine kinase [Bacteroidota bacterium]